MTTTLEAARHDLADAMKGNGALQSRHWFEAFRNVPREAFVPHFTIGHGKSSQVFEESSPGYAEAVYTDTSLVTRWDANGNPSSSSSEPSLMARMLEAFVVHQGPVLEVGTGTGYNAALLCHRFGPDRVVTIDVDPELTAAARERLHRIGYAPTIVTGDGTAGHPEAGPYGGILATCGVDRVPGDWLHQLRPGGILVTNIGRGLVQLVADENGTASGRFLPGTAAFMPARPTAGHVGEKATQYSRHLLNSTGEVHEQVLPEHPEGLDALLHETVICGVLEVSLLQPEVLSMSFRKEEGTVHGFVHPPTGSWARVTPTGDRTAEVVRGGPEDLFGPRMSLMASWNAAGRPGPEAYELTVEADGTHTLRRDGVSWFFH